MELPASQLSEQLTGLATGTPYAVRVTAKNALGRGVANTVGRVKPPVQLPGVPRDVVAESLPGSPHLAAVQLHCAGVGRRRPDFAVPHRMDTTSSFAGSPSSLAVNCEDTHEVQTVRVVPDSGSLDSLHCYRLRLSHNGLTTTTGKVPVTATAMSADEVDGSVLERGLLFGGSMQGHLEAPENVGKVAVRRLGDATDGHPHSITVHRRAAAVGV